MRPILLLLRLPPPYGGGEILSALLRSRLGGLPGYVVSERVNPRGAKSNQGRLTWANIRFAGGRVLDACASIRRHRPSVLYLLLPMSFAAFLWAAAVIVYASAVGVRVCAELAGMRFLFFDSRWKRAMGVAVLRRLYSIRFLGDRIRHDHARYGLRNAVVIPNGIEAPPAEPRSEAFARFVPMHLLYVGSLEMSKGVGAILEAAAVAAERKLPVRWTLLGEWASVAFESWARDWIRVRSLAAVVDLPGLVVGDARWEYYRRSHVLVHPTRFDGQPLTILEAMSQGLAVIATPVGAIPETVVDGRNGTLIEDSSPDRIVDAIERVLDDRDALLRIMRRNREDFLERFTADAFVRSFRAWLESAREGRFPASPETGAPGGTVPSDVLRE